MNRTASATISTSNTLQQTTFSTIKIVNVGNCNDVDVSGDADDYDDDESLPI